jgi:SAM-dependent methyltransferase
MNEIHPNDLLFDYLLRVSMMGDRERAERAYLDGGLDCARKFAALHDEYSGGKKILEFASGYGRVARHIPTLLSEADWTCSDIHPEAIEFIRAKLGLPAFLSAANPTEWRSKTYDVVFALSFFSHVPDRSFGLWLKALSESVTPSGLLIFTTHGRETARLISSEPIQFDDYGFYWATYSDQGDLDSQVYGTSIAKFGYVNRILETLPLFLIRYQEAFWWGHQDLYVVRLRP